MTARNDPTARIERAREIALIRVEAHCATMPLGKVADACRRASDLVGRQGSRERRPGVGFQLQPLSVYSRPHNPSMGTLPDISDGADAGVIAQTVRGAMLEVDPDNHPVCETKMRGDLLRLADHYAGAHQAVQALGIRETARIMAGDVVDLPPWRELLVAVAGGVADGIEASDDVAANTRALASLLNALRKHDAACAEGTRDIARDTVRRLDKAIGRMGQPFLGALGAGTSDWLRDACLDDRLVDVDLTV